MADTSLGYLLQQQLKLFKESISIEHGAYRVTGRELHQKALKLMEILSKLGIQKQEPVAILASRGVNHILSQVTVVYVGGSCVPLDVDLDDQYISNLLLNLRGSTILVDSENEGRLAHLHNVVVNHLLIEVDKHSAYPLPFALEPNCCSHILHTSGSTGQSKAVRVLSSGLINLIFNNFAPISKGNRVAHVCNVGFDVSLWEIWSALMQGATIVIFDHHEILDPVIYEKKLKGGCIDVMWQTTSFLATIAHTCPGVYSYVDTLLTGGEAINLQTIKNIMATGPPRRLFNVYGPTELTAFATYHQITSADIESGHIPIGRPLENYNIHVVDGNLQPVPNGTSGELLVGGAGVTGGYLNNPQKTAEAFVHLQHLAEHGEEEPNIYYRTGDVVQQSKEGILSYLGRRDHEVKIRGQRIDLESVERCLLETRLVSNAVALRVTLEDEGTGSLLLACVTSISGDTSIRDIRQAYVQRAPHVMLPRILLLKSLPLTGSGKVNRKKLVADYVADIRNLKLRPKLLETNGPCTVDDELKLLWQELLDIPFENIHDSDDFFLLGGTSLQAALLVSKIKQRLGLVVRVASLFENSKFHNMAGVLSTTQNGAAVYDTATKIKTWLDDSRLGNDLRPTNPSLPDWTMDSEGKVFLTGATGFVGAFFLAHILTLAHIKTVACLVRAHDPADGFIRIRKTLHKYGLYTDPADERKILVLPGDIGQDNLGLDRLEYDRLALWASIVFHLAAHISFVHPYSSHRASNVIGTLNMIKFSIDGRCKAMHYTSSISAYGPTGMVTGCTYLPENERPATHIRALSYDTGYSQSQLVAESIVWNAIENGIPIAIHRLGLVLGHSKNGTMNPDDFLNRVVKSSIEMGRYPIFPRHREDFAPVDFVVSSLIHIASDPSNLGQAYNLIHPDSTSSIYLPTIFDMLQKKDSKSHIKAVQFSDWVQSLSQMQNHGLASLMPMLQEKVQGDLTRWEMLQDMPKFSRRNARYALRDTPGLLLCPSQFTLMANYVTRWLKSASI
ncbi:acetyl-CoA synthetase-like protein [Penicillium angulare]|uniref:Acetyl-CoA synthetase-like protein n=1 Tax=Penicillium angulare TaxID=116970 RepID=A0A9W9JTF2_9EURO|nr:acetyl-CoA synthetase-like protein [Penicillium angulare]